MIATLDERHIAHGYDPYNSADQPHVMIATNKKFARNAVPRSRDWYQDSDGEIDAKIRRGFQYLENHPQIAAEIFSRALELQRKNPVSHSRLI